MKITIEIEAPSKELVQYQLQKLVQQLSTVTVVVTGSCVQEHLQLNYRIEPDKE